MKKYIAVALLLVVIVLVVYEGLIFYDNNFKYGRMWETPAVRHYEDNPFNMEDGVVPFKGGEALFIATTGEDLISPFQMNDPDVIKLGKDLYFTYCAQCHGKAHDGNGPVGQSFHPLPTDLRSPEVQTRPVGVLFKSISYGIPNGRQPPLATTIELTDRWRIIAYMKSLGPRK
jgi:mono/diheme cytochrome c family protein